MAGEDKRDDQLQDMQTRVDGVVATIQTIHTWLDSMTTSSTERFDRIELAQMSTKTTLDVVVPRLDALHTMIRGLQKDSCGHGHHSGIDSFAKIKLKISLYNVKYDPAVYLDSELEVEQQFSYHDIPATSHVKVVNSEFTNFASMWWRDYNKRHPSKIPTTWDQLKDALRHRFVPFYFARDLLKQMQRFQQGSRFVEDYY
jgi:hypothetical protein